VRIQTGIERLQLGLAGDVKNEKQGLIFQTARRRQKTV